MIHHLLASVAKKKMGGVSEPTPPITAKSVIFDIADNWGDGTLLGIRSIEFELSSSVISLPGTGYSAYASSEFSASYVVENAFDTSLSKTGTASGKEWIASGSSNNNQRIIIVFDSSTDFDRVVINNSHDNGFNTNRGARNVKVTYSASSITDTTYNAAVTGGVLINNREWDEHAASSSADDFVVYPTP